MQTVLLMLVLAITVEGLVEYVKSIAEGKGAKTIALQLGALGASIFLCLVAGADIYVWLGVPFALPYVGSVLTGIFASRGANYVSDLIGKLSKAAGKKS